MKNFIKLTRAMRSIAIIAFVAVMGLGLFSSCDNFFVDDEQTTVTITGIPAVYENMYAWGGLGNPSSTNKKNKDTAVAFHRSIKNGTVKLEMYKAADNKPASVDALALVLLLITETNGSETNVKERYYIGGVRPGSNTVDYADFIDI